MAMAAVTSLPAALTFVAPRFLCSWLLARWCVSSGAVSRWHIGAASRTQGAHAQQIREPYWHGLESARSFSAIDSRLAVGAFVPLRWLRLRGLLLHARCKQKNGCCRQHVGIPFFSWPAHEATALTSSTSSAQLALRHQRKSSSAQNSAVYSRNFAQSCAVAATGACLTLREPMSCSGTRDGPL